MNKETFQAGRISESYKQFADEFGYSYSTIQAVKCGHWHVSKRLEAFITQNLFLSKHEEAVETIIRIFRDDRSPESGETGSWSRFQIKTPESCDPGAFLYVLGLKPLF